MSKMVLLVAAHYATSRDEKTTQDHKEMTTEKAIIPARRCCNTCTSWQNPATRNTNQCQLCETRRCSIAVRTINVVSLLTRRVTYISSNRTKKTNQNKKQKSKGQTS